MPTYEYECKACGYNFDVFQSMSEEPKKLCPTCGKELRRIINGGTGIIFKGSGFYVNDSKKSSGASVLPKSSPNPNTNTDSAPKEAPAPAAKESAAAASTEAAKKPQKENVAAK